MCRMNEPRAGQQHMTTHLRVDGEAVSSQFVELFGKASHDKRPLDSTLECVPLSVNWVEGAIIVGAGPAGLATAACLRQQGVPSLVLEREDCIASLWRYRTYNRLRLHIAKQFCALPLMPFPASFPTFPTRGQFLDYLDEYAHTFNIQPQFNECVQEATYCAGSSMWRVESKGPQGMRTFIGRWLIVATGENAQPVRPDIPGLASNFRGRLCHSSEYKSGEDFSGERVLVIGGGNSGLEVALDLANHQAKVFMSLRSEVHVLPREILGFSTFGVAMALLRFFSLRWTDRLLLLMSRIILGETSQLGFRRPSVGPMELKCRTGKTPSLDAGTLSKIREGCIEVLPEVQEFDTNGCSFTNVSPRLEFDAVILATGFKSNVPSWLKENELFSSEGFPNPDLPSNWKGKNGLYSAGFARKGLLGVSMDALRIAEDISKFFNCMPRML